MKSLFGDEIPDVPPPPIRGRFNVWKVENNYHKSKTEERCANCEHSVRTQAGNKKFWKCKRMGITSSERTDIRAGHICNQYQSESK